MTYIVPPVSHFKWFSRSQELVDFVCARRHSCSHKLGFTICICNYIHNPGGLTSEPVPDLELLAPLQADDLGPLHQHVTGLAVSGADNIAPVGNIFHASVKCFFEPQQEVL